MLTHEDGMALSLALGPNWVPEGAHLPLDLGLTCSMGGQQDR